MLVINTHIKDIENSSQEVASGFQMTFENGNTISVQFGYGNYCDNRNESKSNSKNAEIAIWNNHTDEWFDFGGDTVKGWCSADEVAEWVNFASKNTF